MARSSLLSSGSFIRVTVAGLQALAGKLRALSAEMETTLLEALKECGELVATDARQRVDYSTKIPGSIHTNVAGPGFVRVSTQLPEAVAIENRGRGHVRHPLFGTREHWYNNPQPAFLYPALRATGESFADAAVAAIHEAWEAVMGATE